MRLYSKAGGQTGQRYDRAGVSVSENPYGAPTILPFSSGAQYADWRGHHLLALRSLQPRALRWCLYDRRGAGLRLPDVGPDFT